MIQITRLPQDLRKEAIATTSRAFWPDPLFGFFARNPVQEHRVLPIFLGALLNDSFSHGQVWAAIDESRVVGSASWLPPGSMPRSKLREFRIYVACARSLLAGRNRMTGVQLLEAVELAHPSEPHWYLALLGVDPTRQGRGLGRKLLAPVLAHCDREIEPAYLETQKPENLPFYERFGFRVLDEIAVPGSPTVWLMWRDPEPDRHQHEGGLPHST
ncbi:MAG: GNAT family N-acetyltransferase [Acidimicrobiales bacterium]